MDLAVIVSQNGGLQKGDVYGGLRLPASWQRAIAFLILGIEPTPKSRL
ncbi:hypothetical protein [Nostoc sp.]